MKVFSSAGVTMWMNLSTPDTKPWLTNRLIQIAMFDMEAIFLHPNDNISTASLLESQHSSHNGSFLTGEPTLCQKDECDYHSVWHSLSFDRVLTFSSLDNR